MLSAKRSAPARQRRQRTRESRESRDSLRANLRDGASESAWSPPSGLRAARRRAPTRATARDRFERWSLFMSSRIEYSFESATLRVAPFVRHDLSAGRVPRGDAALLFVPRHLALGSAGSASARRSRRALSVRVGDSSRLAPFVRHDLSAGRVPRGDTALLFVPRHLALGSLGSASARRGRRALSNLPDPRS